MLANKEQLEKWMQAGREKRREDARGTVEDTLRRSSENLIREKEIKNCTIDLGHKKIEGYCFKLYQPVYKSQSIGMVHDISVKVDGETAPRDDIQLILKGGQRVMLYNARTIQDTWWHPAEPITVFVQKNGRLTPGNHELEVTIAEQIMEYYENPLNMVMGNIKQTMSVIK